MAAMARATTGALAAGRVLFRGAALVLTQKNLLACGKRCSCCAFPVHDDGRVAPDGVFKES